MIKAGIVLGLSSYVVNMVFPLIAIPNNYYYLMGMIASVHFLSMWVLINSFFVFYNIKIKKTVNTKYAGLPHDIM